MDEPASETEHVGVTAAGEGAGRGAGDLSSVEICAGGGGLALGLEQAGFEPVLLLDNRPVACETLRMNRPAWDVREMDLRDFDPDQHRHTHDVDLLSAGLPRVKATAAVRRPGDSEPELELLKAAVYLVHGIQPRAVLVENVPDLVTRQTYAPIRRFIEEELTHLGYGFRWLLVDAADYGVPQHRKQGVLIAMKGAAIDAFVPPTTVGSAPMTVGAALADSMATRGWGDAKIWAERADEPAPTLVGGSWERGGGDLGPSGTKRAWERMGVNGHTIADQVPGRDFIWDPSRGREGMVALTVEQTALIQGFPESWQFAGRKTARYRQIGNASPPPVSRALGWAVRQALGAC